MIVQAIGPIAERRPKSRSPNCSVSRDAGGTSLEYFRAIRRPPLERVHVGVQLPKGTLPVKDASC